MKKKLLVLAAAAGMFALSPTIYAQATSSQGTNWIHVSVDGEEDETVRLNLPVSMAAVALETIRNEGLDNDEFGDGSRGDVSLDDARGMWQAMRDAGDAEFLDIQDGDERVRVFREGDRVYVVGNDGEAESLRVEMPVEIADALLASEDDEMDLEAVIQEVIDRGETELVLIRDDDATIRLWVDDQSGQD